MLVTLAYAEKVGLSLHNFTIWVFKYGRVRNLYFLQVLEYYDFQTERSVFCMRVCLMTTMISGGGSLLRSLTGFLGQRWSLVRAGRPNFHPKGSSNKWESLEIFCKSFLDLGFYLAQSNPCCTLANFSPKMKATPFRFFIITNITIIAIILLPVIARLYTLGGVASRQVNLFCAFCFCYFS